MILKIMELKNGLNLPLKIIGKDYKDYEKSSDTMDVWMDSSLAPLCKLSQNRRR